MSTIERRTAYIAVNETTKAAGTRTNIRVNVRIDNIIPIVVYSDKFITDNNIISNTPPTLTDGTVLNTLSEDLNGVERYDYIGYSISAVTNHSVRFYYDNKYNDIIVLPDTEQLVLDTTLQNGKVYHLAGYVLGSSLQNNEKDIFSTFAAEVNEDNSNKLPLCNKNISTTKNHVLATRGLYYNNHVTNTMLGIMLTTNKYLERASTDKTVLVELGLPADLLVTATDKIPCYVPYEFMPGQYTASYCGIKQVPAGLKIGFVLDF